LVQSYDIDTKQAIIEQRNYFEIGTEIEVFHPNGSISSFTLEKMTDLEDVFVDVARHPKQILKIDIPFAVEPYAMLRRK